MILWSPDSKYLAFSGNYPTSKQRGLWLFSTANGSLSMIASGKVIPELWTSDGKGIVALKCGDETCSQVVEFDLSKWIGETTSVDSQGK